MSCFDDAPEFLDEDNRRFRIKNPVSRTQMLAKHEALLPAETLKEKSILDLGSCLGATGHWCLSQGARHYTGVEVQHTYAEQSRRLLGKYHAGKFTIIEQSVEQWLAQPRTEQFDIVCLLGVIYAFSDYFSILNSSAALSRGIVAIEGLYPKVRNPAAFCGVVFEDSQRINMADKNASVVGRGTRVSPKGLEWLMEEFGFDAPLGVILPQRVTDIPDIYNRSFNSAGPVRYLMRFERGVDVARSVSSDLQEGAGRIEFWDRTLYEI